jgi:hypothetical protein
VLSAHKENSRDSASFSLLLGEGSLQPQQTRLKAAVALSLFPLLSFSIILNNILRSKMPLANGDIAPSQAHLLTGKAGALDHKSALEILERDYPEKDGLDVYTLLNSAKNGGLTYNDFLVLPGYIGTLQQIEFAW